MLTPSMLLPVRYKSNAITGRERAFGCAVLHKWAHPMSCEIKSVLFIVECESVPIPLSAPVNLMTKSFIRRV